MCKSGGKPELEPEEGVDASVLVTGRRTSSLDSCGMSIVFIAGARESLLDSWLDVAFRLPTDGSQLRNHQVVRTFEHALFAERERLEMAQVSKVLEHVGDFEDIAGPHLV